MSGFKEFCGAELSKEDITEILIILLIVLKILRGARITNCIVEKMIQLAT